MDIWDVILSGDDEKDFGDYVLTALGEKTGENDKESLMRGFRTILILQGVITNILISINILISWFR